MHPSGPGASHLAAYSPRVSPWTSHADARINSGDFSSAFVRSTLHIVRVPVRLRVYSGFFQFFHGCTSHIVGELRAELLELLEPCGYQLQRHGLAIPAILRLIYSREGYTREGCDVLLTDPELYALTP
jgi:hypothetical protein